MGNKKKESVSVSHGSGWNFTRVRNSIIESDLGKNEKMVYIVLAYFADKNGECFPSYSSVAKHAGITRKTAIESIKKLCEKGWIEKQFRSDEEGDSSSNLYKLMDPTQGGGVTTTPGVVYSLHHGGVTTTPRVVYSLHPNESHIEREPLNEYEEPAKQVIDYLNERAEKRFSYRKTNIEKITARLREGFTVDDARDVIEAKVRDWKGDPKMDQFLRPQTLFAPSHFESYLNSAPKGIEAPQHTDILDEKQRFLEEHGHEL